MPLKTMKVSEGDERELPSGAAFLIGLGWEGADLDLMVLRYDATGVTPIVWANEDLECPELGTTKKGKPYLATPERDVIHHGDDTDGSESQGGFDEICDLDPSKAPAGTTQYVIFASNWIERNRRDPNNPQTLGDASDVIFGIQQVGSTNRFEVDLARKHAFDVTACIAAIVREPNGTWVLKNVQGQDLEQQGIVSIGSSDDLIEVAEKAMAAAA
jgi:hypothetical protein